MFVDTGAGAHIVSDALAWYLGLRRTRSDMELVDVTSAKGSVHHVDGGLALLGTHPLLSSDAPYLDAIGIAGLLSPQALVSRDRAVVIDLAAGRMSLTRPTARPIGPLVGAPCRGVIGSVYLVDAQIGGHAVRLEVDTGAPHTSLYADSVAGRTLHAANADALVQSELDELLGEDVTRDRPQREVSAGIVGARTVIVLPHQTVRAGGTAVPLDVRVAAGRDEACHSDGWLGLDFLSGWTIAIDARGLAGHPGLATPSRPLPALPPLPPIVFEGIDVTGACPGSPTVRITPERFENPLAAWPLVTGRVHAVEGAHREACERAGYLRAATSTDLTISSDRRTSRGIVTVTAGRRYRNGKITLRPQDGVSLPPIVLDRMKPDDWHAPSQIVEQAAELDRQLAPLGLHVVGTITRIEDAEARVDVELVVGR